MLNLERYTKEFRYNLKLAYPVIIGLLGHTLVQLVGLLPGWDHKCLLCSAVPVLAKPAMKRQDETFDAPALQVNAAHHDKKLAHKWRRLVFEMQVGS